MIDLSNMKGRTIAVMGLGKTGESTCAALLKADAKVMAWDDREETRSSFKYQDILIDLNSDNVDFDKIDSLILSPGIPHHLPSPHPIATKAREALVPVHCDVELFAKSVTKIPYVAITGTNGKSTSTALIGHILSAMQDTEIGGNIGKPVLSMKQRGVKSYVLELSSYQLERCPSLAPEVAVWLNITPDHIDRHGDMDGYINAKKRIFSNYKEGAIAVIGVDDDYSAKVADDLEHHSDWTVERVTINHKLEKGYYVDNGVLYRKQENEDDAFICTDLKTYPKLKGIHNWQNAACAFATCEAMGLSAQDIENAMRSFAGLAHRQFIVDVINGVPYINDSKATNADAASMALRSFDHIYWILGGKAKEGGLDGLETYAPKIKHAFVIGEAQEEFSAWLKKQDIPYSLCGTIDVATQAAHNAAQSGRGQPGGAPVVLLSPACASFDQFSSFEERGDAFTTCVKKLASADIK